MAQGREESMAAGGKLADERERRRRLDDALTDAHSEIDVLKQVCPDPLLPGLLCEGNCASPLT